MAKEYIKISGMTCAACAMRIEKAVGKLDGVSNASVNFAAEKLFVEFDNLVINISDIKEKIEKIGYKPEETAGSGSVIIPVGGMTCAACSQRIEKVIGKIDGVLKVSVNPATEKAAVEYDTQKTRLSVIKQAIEQAGYKAFDIEKKDSTDKDKLRKEKEIRTLWRKFITAAVFALPLLYLAMGPMIPWLPFPIPEILNRGIL